jgi:aminoglycoside phosphotransferase (APT) family kinase protein
VSEPADGTVRHRTGLDPATGRWLAARLPGERVDAVRALSGGFRNENLLVTTASGRRVVLRRYLRDNSCAVEAALAERLRGTVPVPEVLAAEPTGEATGTPLLLTTFEPGDLASTVLANRPADPGGLGVAVGSALAALGTLTFERPGFFAGPDLVPGPAGLGGGLAAFVAERLATGNADHLLGAAERTALLCLAEADDALLATLPPTARLVHSDYNPKNLLVSRGPDGWAVTAVLDWEFAFSGHPLSDVGNLLRFAEDYPPGFADGALAGFSRAGGELPPRWRELAAALDLFALVEMLTRPGGGALTDRVAAVVRRRLAA